MFAPCVSFSSQNDLKLSISESYNLTLMGPLILLAQKMTISYRKSVKC